MRQLTLNLCFLILASWTGGGSAFALGTEEFGNAPVNKANYADWPELVPALNHTTRYYQSWVNGHERFVGLASTPQINELVKLYLAANLEQPEIVLLPGPGKTHTFQQQVLPCDWEIEICGGISKHLTTVDQGGRVWPASPRLTIYVGDRVRCEDLQIPAGAKVVTAAELKRRCQAAILDSTDTSVRGWGCGILAAIDPYDVDSARMIAARLADKDNWVRLNAAGALQPFGQLARPHKGALEAAGETTDAALKQRVTETLAILQSAPAVDAQVKARAERQAAIDAWLATRQKR